MAISFRRTVLFVSQIVFSWQKTLVCLSKKTLSRFSKTSVHIESERQWNHWFNQDMAFMSDIHPVVIV